MKNIGLKSILFSVLLAGVGAVFAPSETFAQGRYVGQYSRANVDNIVRRVEDSGDEFRRDFRNALDRSNLSNTQKRNYRGQVDGFERATDQLRSRFDRENDWWQTRSQVQDVVAAARPLNITMNRIGFRRTIERQWNRLRNDVNTLADTYDLPGIAGGGWQGGGPGPGGGGGAGVVVTPPNWAQGVFYGRAPNGSPITLTIARNGSVNAQVDGQTLYGSFRRGNILRMGNDTSRVTRSGNGIVTTRTDIGERIVYSRTGGGGGGGWTGGQIAPPSWARGTFQGRSPQGSLIILTIAANGNVTARIGNNTLYGSYTRGSYLTIDGAVSRVTRIGNGLRTTRTDNGEVIDYRRR